MVRDSPERSGGGGELSGGLKLDGRANKLSPTEFFGSRREAVVDGAAGDGAPLDVVADGSTSKTVA
jgi:hypothetical protein